MAGPKDPFHRRRLSPLLRRREERDLPLGRKAKGKASSCSRADTLGSEHSPAAEPGSNCIAVGSSAGPSGVLRARGARIVRPNLTIAHRAGRCDSRGNRINSPNILVVPESTGSLLHRSPFGLPNSLRQPAKDSYFQGVYCLSRDGSLPFSPASSRAPTASRFHPMSGRSTSPTPTPNRSGLDGLPGENRTGRWARGESSFDGTTSLRAGAAPPTA